MLSETLFEKLKSKRIYSIEGNIGAGKTTILKLIGKTFEDVEFVEEIGPMSYPGRSHGQGILVNFKISDSTLVAKKVNHENSDEVIVGSNTEGLKRL